MRRLRYAGGIRRLLAPSLLVALLTLGCSSAPTRRSEPVPGLRVSALMVEPLRTAGGVGDDETLALSARLGLRAVTTVSGRALIWGPSEVRLLHPERTDWTATDALTVVRAAGLVPTEVLLVRARLERNSAQGRQEVSNRSGGSAAGASAEWVDRVRVELIQPSTGSIVVESAAEVRVDPFGGDGQGPGPLIDRVLDDAIGGLEAHWTRAPLPALEVWQLLAPSGGAGLDAEVKRLEQLRLANPGLGEDDAARLLRRPPGVFVRQAEIITRLHSGDVVTSVDGVAASPQSLDRARQGTREVRLEVEPATGAARRVRWP